MVQWVVPCYKAVNEHGFKATPRKIRVVSAGTYAAHGIECVCCKTVIRVGDSYAALESAAPLCINCTIASSPPERRKRPNNQCSGCAFWIAHDDPEDDGENSGECRRFPPQLPPRQEQEIDNVRVGIWPETMDKDWCGEWRKK